MATFDINKFKQQTEQGKHNNFMPSKNKNNGNDIPSEISELPDEIKEKFHKKNKEINYSIDEFNPDKFNEIFNDVMNKNKIEDIEPSMVENNAGGVLISKNAIDQFLTDKRQIRFRMNFYKRYSSIIATIIERDGINGDRNKLTDRIRSLIEASESLTKNYIKNLLDKEKLSEKSIDWGITQLLPVMTDLVISNWKNTGNKLNSAIKAVEDITNEIENERVENFINLQFDETKIYPLTDDKFYIAAILSMNEVKGMVKMFQFMIDIDLDSDNRYIWSSLIKKNMREYINKKKEDDITRSLDRSTRLMYLQNQMNACNKLMYSALTRYVKQEMNKNIKPSQIDIKPAITYWKSIMNELDYTVKIDMRTLTNFNSYLNVKKQNISKIQTLPKYFSNNEPEEDDTESDEKDA